MLEWVQRGVDWVRAGAEGAWGAYHDSYHFLQMQKSQASML